MISFVLNDPSVEIDNTDVNVIRTLAALNINDALNHKDPFDHIIIAQAISHKMTLVSSDTKFPFYRKQGLRLIENLLFYGQEGWLQRPLLPQASSREHCQGICHETGAYISDDKRLFNGKGGLKLWDT